MIYEINTRVWLKQFDVDNKPVKLLDVPLNYWKDLKNKGMKYIWLMGIWKTVPSIVNKYCFAEGLLKEYNHTLPDWEEEDVIGSPYAIDRYEINPQLGSKEELIELKVNLNKLGLKLILDFIPNHFSVETSLLKEQPEIFLNINEELSNKDSVTFYQSSITNNFYAHGKDPHFAAWQDTIQINYFSVKARKFMTSVLLDLTELCDGVRCDMAMLMINSVFKRTWKEVKNTMHYRIPRTEFWSCAIEKVKKKRKDFIFIAEAYWDLEFELQQLGFDYTYDKRLYDRLLKGDVKQIYDHLIAGMDYQNKSVRFIENHDEQRAMTAFKVRFKAAAVIMNTIPGLKLFYDGQFVGKRIKLPVQLGREPIEKTNYNLRNFYDKLLSVIKDKCISDTGFSLLNPVQAWDDNDSHKNILTWLWKNSTCNKLVVVNYSPVSSVCRINLNVETNKKNILFKDLLNGEEYLHPTDEIIEKGLYIQLNPYESHIFSF